MTVLLLQAGAGVTFPLPTLVSQAKVQQRFALVPETNESRLQALRDLFGQAGCAAPQLTEQPVRGSTLPNLVCRLAGETEEAIYVGAHFDVKGRGSKGAIDNWSGASLLPSLYEALKGKPRKHTFIFIGFTDEELGLVGSRFFVSQLGKNEIAAARAMINLDSIGSSPTKVELRRGDRQLVQWMGLVASHFKFPLAITELSGSGNTDSTSFADRKVRTVSVHSITDQSLKQLHTKKDVPEAVSVEDLFRTYELVATYLAFLDQVIDRQ